MTNGIRRGPYWSGRAAFINGHPAGACPYRDPAAKAEWLKGYDAAKRVRG